MTRRRRDKQTRVLTQTEAESLLNCADFYQEVFDRTYNLMYGEFVSRFVRDPSFESLYEREVSKCFHDLYHRSTEELVTGYVRRYSDEKCRHFAWSFKGYVEGVMCTKVEHFFLGPNPTDGYGAIYGSKCVPPWSLPQKKQTQDQAPKAAELP